MASFGDQLLNSIKFYSNNEAKSLLDENLITAKNNYGTLLHYAAKYDNDHIAQHLIELGSDIDSLGQGKQTPLMVAVLHINVRCIKILLGAGANIDIVNAKGQTALHMIFNCGYMAVKYTLALFVNKLKTQIINIETIAIKLINAGCTLHCVTHLEDYDLMASMLKCGVDINSKNVVNGTALNAAVQLNNLKLVKWLLENGANVNILDEIEKRNLVLLVIYYCSKDMLQFLLEKGLSANTKIETISSSRCIQSTPLLAFIEDKSIDAIDCIELLLQYGAIPKNPIGINRTIFDYAFMLKDTIVAKYLIAQIVMLEKMGTSINKSKVMHCYDPSNQAKLASLDDYYKNCDNILEMNLFQKLSLLFLLTDREFNFRRYVRNEDFISEIHKAFPDQKFGTYYRYYYKSLMKRIAKAVDIVRLENIAILILCEIFGSNENECYIAARKVVGYLDKRELERLVELQN